MRKPLSKQAVIAVVGTGAMGAGIAQVAAAAGHSVKLLDNRPEAAARVVAGIRAQFAKMAEKGRMTAEAAVAAGERLIAVHQLSDLADASLVIEAIVENLDAKLMMSLSATRGENMRGTADAHWTEYMKAFNGRLFRPDVAPPEGDPGEPEEPSASRAPSQAPTLNFAIKNPMFEPDSPKKR